jgi:catechol 2,3-dioxygenase-like lactoylglutathione lyase family enzyme
MSDTARLSATVLGSPDPRALGRFYRDLLGWDVVEDEPDWVMLRPPGGGAGLSFQLEPDHVPPVWPAGPHDQQMQAHLDIAVPDLAEGSARALALGARLSEHRPEDDVLVHHDPDGHVFCLFADHGPSGPVPRTA